MNELCGCCDGLEKLTPTSIANRPGLSSLSYRVGTHATFLSTMMARLSDLFLETAGEEFDDKGHPVLKKSYPLHGLRTRSSDDPSIALLDAWATIADILTFYQERIASEAFLRTATERLSVMELARLVDYSLRPGVASSVYLAFTLDHGYDVSIPEGTRAQSIPGPGELIQSFETSEMLEARWNWNALKPRQTRPQNITFYNADRHDGLWLQGLAANIKPQDQLVLVFSNEMTIPRQVQEVELQPAFDRTKVVLQAASAVQSRANLIDGVQRAVVRYLSMPTQETEVAYHVRTIGNTLVTSLRQVDSTEGLGKLLQDTVQNLNAEISTALDKESTPVQIIRELTGNLELIARRAELLRGRNQAALSAHSIVEPTPVQVSSSLGKLGDLIEPLSKAPSVQPRNSLRLGRDLVELVFGQSDISPQLFLTMNRSLATTLYPAWSNARLTPSPDLVRIEAMRVKAAPFGHNARLKPILNESGVPVDYEEWPLYGTLAVSLQLLSGKNISNEDVHALISIELGTEKPSMRQGLRTVLKIDDSQTLTGDGLSVVLSSKSQDNQEELGREITAEVKDENNSLMKTIKITIEPNHDIDVSIDNGPERALSTGQSLRLRRDERKLTIEYPSSNSLFISDESPVPVPEELRKILTLDASYDQITPNSLVVVERPDVVRVIKVNKVRTVSRADYGISGKVTQLKLEEPWLDPTDLMLTVARGTTVYANGEIHFAAEEPLDPVEDNLCGDSIELEGIYDGLKSGRWLIVSGERTDIPDTRGVRASELVMVASVTQDVWKVPQDAVSERSIYSMSPVQGEVGQDYEPEPLPLPGDKAHTFIKLANKLAYCYRLDSVTIFGNVTKATHGETRSEVLGSGDGSVALQEFLIRQRPITYLPAPTPAGAKSTLRIMVDDLEWHETDNLAGLEPADRKFISRRDEKGQTTVIFGNGQKGARLPTDSENVKAVYRTGIGKPGNVKSGQIRILASRPLGVKEVTNPLPATGGADTEDLDQARGNVPLAVMALDRLVSVQDYADFARTFAGIGKARAVRLTDGKRQVVHITIAGADDIPIDQTSDLYLNLLEALHRNGDPHQPLNLALRELMLLVISAGVCLQPDYQWESVAPKIRAALLDAFSFQRRELGQDVLHSEVVTVIQQVPGVAYVDVDVLGAVPERKVDEESGERRILTPEEIIEEVNEIIDGSAGIPPARIAVSLAQLVKGVIWPDQIAYLTPQVPDSLIIKELKS